MYSRTINGEDHTFGVSGKLIMNALVMYDHQTGTLWSQFLRRGVSGELSGTELDVVPVTQTNWSTWRDLHPDTKVLDTGGGYRSDSYTNYYSGPAAGVIGEANRDDRLSTKSLVVGVDFDGHTKAYPLTGLELQPVLNDTVAELDVLVYLDEPSGTALVFDRVVDGRTLTFEIEGEPAGIQTIIVDGETGTRWMAFTGLAVEGELKGRRMNRVPSHLSFWFAWTDWNPDTELFTR